MGATQQSKAENAAPPSPIGPIDMGGNFSYTDQNGKPLSSDEVKRSKSGQSAAGTQPPPPPSVPAPNPSWADKNGLNDFMLHAKLADGSDPTQNPDSQTYGWHSKSDGTLVKPPHPAQSPALASTGSYWSGPKATPENSTPPSTPDIPSFGGPLGNSFDIGEYIKANDTYNVLKGIPKSQPPSTILRPQPSSGNSRMAGQAIQQKALQEMSQRQENVQNKSGVVAQSNDDEEQRKRQEQLWWDIND